jgi:hypothetical protein
MRGWWENRGERRGDFDEIKKEGKGDKIRSDQIRKVWLTCAVLRCIWEKAENVLYQPVLVRDDKLTDFRRDRIDHDGGVWLKVIDAVHRYGKCCTKQIHFIHEL